MFKKIAFFSLSVGILVFLYYFQFRSLVLDYFADRSPIWFSELVENLYPRLVVEKQRFDPVFFISKADQIVWRVVFVGMLFFVFKNIQNPQGFKNLAGLNFDQKIPKKRVRYFTVLFFGLSLLEVWRWHENFEAMQAYLFFYEPVFLLKILQIPFPNLLVINILYFIFSLACAFCLLNFRVFESGTVAIFLLIFFQALHQGFAKTDHAYATWLYASLFFPFLLWENRKPDPNGEVAGWAWQLIRIAICTAYLQAGLEKLWISGGAWASAETFRAYLLMFGTEMGKTIAESEFLCTILPVGALTFQLFFISILFIRRLLFIFLPLGVLFHGGVYVLFGIGGYLTAWWVVYLFFVEWEKIYEILRKLI